MFPAPRFPLDKTFGLIDALDGVNAMDEVSNGRAAQAHHLQSVCQEMGLPLGNDLALRAVDHHASRNSSVMPRTSILQDAVVMRKAYQSSRPVWDQEFSDLLASHPASCAPAAI